MRAGRYLGGVQPPSALDILVVDDDEPLREMLTRSFEREGHRVTAVADGEAAIAQATERDFDVVLLDVALGPGPAGHDVARALRQRRAVVPIIMLTALDSEADVVQGLEAGADDYVTKPFGLAELHSRIRAVLRRSGQPAGAPHDPAVTVGGLRIDPRTRVASVEGTRLDLTPREFELLHYLAVRAGEVVSKRELLTEVWQVPYTGADKTVDVHLSWLRRKLGETAQEPRYLHTVRRVGVRLVDPDGAS